MSLAKRSRRLAVFLDRDDTLIRNIPYLADPRAIEILPGATEALIRLREAGFALVLATNQSIVGRGLITEARLVEIHDEMGRLLASRGGAALDAIYYCTHAPRIADRTVVEHPDRKPGHGMLTRAAEELGLDLSASWMVGDQISDTLAGLGAGCRSILIGSNATLAELPESVDLARAFAAPDLAAAATMILHDLHRSRVRSKGRTES